MFVFVSLQENAQPDMWNIPLAYIPTTIVCVDLPEELPYHSTDL